MNILKCPSSTQAKDILVQHLACVVQVIEMFHEERKFKTVFVKAQSFQYKPMQTQGGTWKRLGAVPAIADAIIPEPAVLQREFKASGMVKSIHSNTPSHKPEVVLFFI